MRHRFTRSLKMGAAGEARIHAMFPSWTRLDGFKADFQLPNGDTVEVKTESRASTDTPNIAAELESSPGRPGAIERAVNDGIKYVIYLYADNVYVIYDSKALLTYLKTATHRRVSIPNVGYNTLIMLIPRDAIKHIEVQIVD